MGQDSGTMAGRFGAEKTPGKGRCRAFAKSKGTAYSMRLITTNHPVELEALPPVTRHLSF